MTPSQLKYQVEAAGHEPHFFSRETMKFFGDTMKNYGVRAAQIVSSYDKDGNYVEDGVSRMTWELHRIRPVKHGLKCSAYFDMETYKRVHPRKPA